MRLCVFLLAFSTFAAAAQVDPRGARPVVPNTRSEKCATQKEWPFCTDDQFGPKCPSGCRIHGLLEKFDHGFLKRIERIRGLLEQNQAKHRNANEVSKQTHNYLREKLTLSSGLDNNYYDMATTLRQRISEMKIKIDQQLQVLAALKERVRDQVQDMQRLEVDIDMKLRSCKGSCKTYHSFEVDHEEHMALEKQMNQLDTLSGQTVQSVGTLHVMKSRPLKDAVVDSVFKSGDQGLQAQQQQTTEDMFPEVKTVQLFLEVEGSSSSPATISKVPGTSLSPDSTPGPGSSGSSSSSHMSLTELGGADPFGFGGGLEALGQPGVTTKSVSCTKRVRTVVVDNGDGPVQKMEEYMEGGPECQAFSKGSGGGMGALFPSFTDSSGTKTVSFTSSSKGSLGDSKTSFGVDPFGGDPGMDLGAFLTDNADDDVPDFHARSVKSVRVERQADYVGKVCLRLSQHGRQSQGPYSVRKRDDCEEKKPLPLCSDHDSESRCPSGCRLQGLILEHETKVENKLRTVCKISKTIEDAAEKTIATTARVYHRNRDAIVSQSKLQVKFAEDAGALAKNLTLLQKRSKSLETQMTELRGKVQQQLDELLQTQVEVELTLRSCLGSCRSARPISTALDDFTALRSQLEQTDSPSSWRRHVGNVPEISTAPVDFGPERIPIYKTIRAVLSEGLDLFEDLQPPRLQIHERSDSDLK